MSIDQQSAEGLKRKLSKLPSVKSKRLTTKELIEQLTPVLHQKVLEGYQLQDLFEEVKVGLPEGAKLTFYTFRKYWQDARREQGLPPTKTWNRKGPTEEADRSTKPAIIRRDESQPISSEDKANTSVGYRDMGGEL